MLLFVLNTIARCLKNYRSETHVEFFSKEIIIYENLHLLSVQRSSETELEETSNNVSVKIEDM